MAGDTCREAVEGGEVGCVEVGLHVFDLVLAGNGLCLVGSEDVVELGDELLDCRDEFDEAFRDDDGAEVVALGGACRNCVGDVGDDVVEALLLGLDLLGNEADVRLGLECALEGDMGC